MSSGSAGTGCCGPDADTGAQHPLIAKVPRRPVHAAELAENAGITRDFPKLFAKKIRLEILCTLADGKKLVGEPEAPPGVRQPALSQQPARLPTGKAVAARRNGG